jgi:peptidyl-prolyl cis-trans isomerase SurA
MAKIRYYVLGVFLLLFAVPVYGQVKDSEVLFTVGGDTVTAGEFRRMYLKNIDQTEGQKQSPEEYLQLYINFKLKVHEARVLGYDTVKDYRQELARYRKQLAEPYVVDPALMDSLVHEGYEHLKKEVSVSHILVRLGENEDTTEAWNKIMEIRRKIEAGASFEETARAVSEDPSAKNNGGKIGYFTAFQMVYPFEEAAYRLKPGELSMPVRTRFGYHLILVDSVKPNPGKIHVAHIMIAVPRRASEQMREAARDTINMIYEKLKNGADFAELAKKYSQDYSTAKTGGVLPWFGPGRMIPSFANVAFSLKENGEISEPVQTPYGWHIIKRLDMKPIGTFEEMEPEIRKQVNRSDRLKIARDRYITLLMQKYHAVADTALLEQFAAEATLEKHNLTWSFPPEIANRTVFTFRDLKVPFKDFYSYIHRLYPGKDQPVDAFVKERFEKYARQKVLNYRKAHLEEEYPDFAAIIKEYSEGMLMFNIMDDKVWSKAVEDSVGLKKYYEDHIERYMSPGKLVADRFVLNDPALMKKVLKDIKKSIKKGMPLSGIVTKYNKGDRKVVTMTRDTVTLEKGKEDERSGWKKGSVHTLHGGKAEIWVVKDKIPPRPVPLKEQLGIVTSDYQNYLEKQWVEELKKKYPVEINKEVFNRLKKELEKS